VIGRDKCTQNFGGKRERRGQSDDLGVDEKIILEWISGKYGGNLWTEFICLRTGKSGVFFNTVMNFGVPEKIWNFLASLVTVSFSRRTVLH
jgi:hypothetical protein